MVKKLNGYLLTKKVRHKFLVKVRPFSGAKVSCMVDHVKPTIRDFKPYHVILHTGTNDLHSEKTANQIARSVTELAMADLTEMEMVVEYLYFSAKIYQQN